jgi:hypothetical protein
LTAATALDETADEPGTHAVGQFRTLRDITILDLVQLPSIPSIFAGISDSLPYDPHEALRFYIASRMTSRARLNGTIASTLNMCLPRLSPSSSARPSFPGQ